MRPLPLPATPAVPLKVHAEPVGLILVGRRARPLGRVFEPGVDEVGGGAVEGAHEVGAILEAGHLLHISLGAIGEHLDRLPEELGADP